MHVMVLGQATNQMPPRVVIDNKSQPLLPRLQNSIILVPHTMRPLLETVRRRVRRGLFLFHHAHINHFLLLRDFLKDRRHRLVGSQYSGCRPLPQDRENSYTPTATTADRRTDKTSTSRVLKKLRRSITTPDMLLPDSVSPHQLPEDLRKVLEVLENGIFDGHVILSENLRKRYEEQYPLVRSLADVFVSNVSFIFTILVCLRGAEI